MCLVKIETSTEKNQYRIRMTIINSNSNQKRNINGEDSLFIQNSLSRFNQWLSAARILHFLFPICERFLSFGWAKIEHVAANLSPFSLTYIILGCSVIITGFNNPKVTNYKCFDLRILVHLLFCGGIL
jgi:hypothetical protein